MRKPPALRPPGYAPADANRIQRSYRFLTPVFGGGVRLDGARKPADPVTPVRGASIVGQLRFWWRACNPRGCRTLADLAAAEAAVFGSTREAGKVWLSVAEQPALRQDFAVLEGKFDAVKGRRGLAYGAFPLRDTDGGQRHGVLHDHGSSKFALDVTCGAHRADLEAALWAWAHFGGLGGRTRRGFGAVEQVDPAPVGLAEGWARFVAGVKVPWPHLAERPAIGRQAFENGTQALEALLGAFQRLRQGPGTGRRKGQQRPGRSYWPEADAIRRQTGQRAASHQTPVSNADAFPRAAFGTPIIFHFKDPGDPRDTTLVPEGRNRLASPLVLRPHRLGPADVRGMAVVLRHPDVRYELVDGKKRRSVRAQLTLAEAKGLPGPPWSDGPDPILRFLKEIP